jgi:hypothetical protein
MPYRSFFFFWDVCGFFAHKDLGQEKNSNQYGVRVTVYAVLQEASQDRSHCAQSLPKQMSACMLDFILVPGLQPKAQDRFS